MKYWHIFWSFRKIWLVRTLEYRGNFFFWAFVSLIWTVFNFFFFGLIINAAGNVAGWSREQMFLLLSVFTIIEAFTWSWFYHNMSEYTDSVFSGELNNILTKPIDAQYLLMTKNNSYTNSTRLVIGVGMLFWSLNQLGISPNWQQWLMFIITITASLLLIYSLWFIMSTLSFYVERLDNVNEIIPSARRIWQVPRAVFTGLLSTIFVVLIPVALATSVPSEILLGQDSWGWGLYLIASSLITLFISRLFFKFSIKRYSGMAN